MRAPRLAAAQPLTLLLVCLALCSACSDPEPLAVSKAEPPRMPVYPSVEPPTMPPPMPARSIQPTHARLPDVAWREEGGAVRGFAQLRSAPFPMEGAPYDDSTVLIAFPEQLDRTQPVPVVIHLHGFNVELREMVRSKQLVEQLLLSGRNAVLIVPQGPLLANSGHFGRLMHPDGFKNLVTDVLAVLARDAFIERPEPGPVVVSAHSGGYKAASRAILVGGLRVETVFLFDSLYGEVEVFKSFVERGGRLRSLYTDGGGTRGRNLTLMGLLEEEGILTSDRLRGPGTRAVISWSSQGHSDCVRVGRPFARWLAGSGLPRLPGALPPELGRRWASQ